MSILQLSRMGFELRLLRLQSQTLTIELTPHGQSMSSSSFKYQINIPAQGIALALNSITKK